MAARKHIVPIFLPHWGCPYRCVYCNQNVIAAQEGMLEISGEIRQALTKVPPSAYPVEVAFYGGTFTALPWQLQLQLLDQVQPFMVGGEVDSIRVSTHPACLNSEHLAQLAHRGVTTIELGVQSLDPQVLASSGRGYNPAVVGTGVKLLRGYGFKVGVQLMPGLPRDTLEKTLQTVRRVIELAPDFVRVYPTLVIEHTDLAELWRSGQYAALTLDQAVDWCKQIAKLFDAANIPIIRMGLHPSAELERELLAGPYHPAFRALVDSALALDQIRAQVTTRGGQLIVYCNPREISRVRGDKNQNITELKAEFGFDNVRVVADPELRAGEFRLDNGTLR